MTDEEIYNFNKNNFVEFERDTIRHGTHRVYAMIGRLVREEKYIPFYISKDRFLHPTYKINYLNP